MNILHIIRDLSPETGGPVAAVIGLARAQVNSGHTVRIVSTNAKECMPELPGEVECRLFRTSSRRWRTSKALASALPALVKEADIVHLHTMWEYPTLAGSRACKAIGRPYILRPCGMLEKSSLGMKSWKKSAYMVLVGQRVVRRAAGVHFTSNREYHESKADCFETPSFVVPLGVSEKFLGSTGSLSTLSNRFRCLAGHRVFLFLGRLHPIKRPDVVIRAFAEVVSEWPEAHLVMAGPAEEKHRQNLLEMTRQLGLCDRITFTGMLHGEEVIEALSLAYAFVLPSTRENFGMAVAEAMGAGCPVIVSDAVALHEEVAAASAGIVVPGKAKAVANAFRKLLSYPDLRDRMGENGRRLVHEKFTWSRAVADLNNIYEDILRGTRTNPIWRV